MAAIDDLIAQIEDKALRERLRMETNRITKEKKFGLVFEDHLPELTPIYSAKIRRHSKVALRDGPLADLWRVLSVRDSEANCRNIGSGETREISVDDLVVVRQFGEPIFPALVPVDKVQNGPDDAPWHTLIEADNYHALQLLEYIYAGKVDCIYIDPPYNSGATDWKYNNDYVDVNDAWRHSKWLAMMQRRLKFAKRLLNPNDSVLIVTIDEKEYLRLGLLLEQCFPEAKLRMISTEISRKGSARSDDFARVDEYIFVLLFGKASVDQLFIDGLSVAPEGGRKEKVKVQWESMLRRGTGSMRTDSHLKFYPVLIDPKSKKVVGRGEILPLGQHPADYTAPQGLIAVWPMRSNGAEGRWQLNTASFSERFNDGHIKAGRFNKDGTCAVLYLPSGLRAAITESKIVPSGTDANGGPEYEWIDPDTVTGRPKTQWQVKYHNASEYGTALLKKLLPDRSFPFPKSLYAVEDVLRLFISYKPSALVLDFFSGSGTTAHAVMRLNHQDGGRRRCISVTNNEVAADEQTMLSQKGLRPGDSNWEMQGICQHITLPRLAAAITGKSPDGNPIESDYLTGVTVETEKSRKFLQFTFTSIEGLNTAAKKKQLVALIDGIPQSEVKKDSAFVVSEKHPASILFDDSQADAWLEALEDQEHITDYYIVTDRKATFDDLKARIHELLGPVIVSEEEKRPMREGFPANLEYFRLNFLDKDHVALGRQFREILPILWLQAGAIGPRPELPKNKPIPAMVIPEHNPFAVLVEETRFADFTAELEGRDDLTHAYLVTDSEEAFQEMAGQLKVPNVIQLYRDYLENFVINKGEDAS